INRTLHKADASEESYVCVSVSTGADPQAPSTCRPYGGSALLARAWEHPRLSFYTLPPRAGTVACIFGRGLTQTQRFSLRAGSTCISQSSAGPIDGAGDGIKMGTSGLLCEDCFPKMSLSTRRHCAPGLQFERCFLIRSFQAYSIAHNNRRTHPAVARPAATIGAATREPQLCTVRSQPFPMKSASKNGRSNRCCWSSPVTLTDQLSQSR